LDNCEHLLAVCASVATRLLGCCPRLRILVTSRESLGVPGEVTWRVPSLAFPWPDYPLSLEQLGRFGAIALFVERARAARPGFEIAAADIAALSSICFRLDGIPLALELAAARISAMSVREIADRLDDRFTLLTRPSGGLARHQTLRASLDWSCQLLGQRERALFRRLAVFSGGWSLRAAESVCADKPVRPDHVARLLAALVDKSLVQAEDTVTGTRYRLLEAVKPFAHDQLVDSGESGDIRARHGRYFADLSEQAATGLCGPDQAYWASCLDQDQANLRIARRWCAADPARAALGLAMASSLGQYWLIRGELEEGDDWLREALERASGQGGARATALGWLAVVTSLRSGFPRELFEASIALHEQAGDRDGQARFLAILGFWRANQGDPQGAAKALADAFALSAESQDRYIPAFVLMMASIAASLTGDIAVARASATQSIKLFVELGDRLGAGYARTVLADCLAREGDPQKGLAILRVCVGDFEAITDRWGLLLSAGSAALAHAALGDWARTIVAAGVADGLSERIGGQTAPGVQAAVDAAALKAAAELGVAVIPLRDAGRAAGRSDRIAAALGLVPGAEPACPHPQHELLLTKREVEITQLIAAGLTNRQIAERLFITQRTVDTHVGHILAKLGCSNRAQVAVLTITRNPAGQNG
jgi:non-specific serine/threonine protein kinase